MAHLALAREKPQHLRHFSVNVGAYRLLSDDYRSRFGNTIPLRFWHLPQSEAQARKLMKEFALMLDFFESMINPDPFGDEKMGVVETAHKGMEHQPINAYGNKYAKTMYGYDDLLQHEFAHQWFGNQVTNMNWDDVWLHQGLGSYMQPLSMQYLRGDQEHYTSLMKLRSAIVDKAAMVSGKPHVVEDVYDIKRGGPGQDIDVKGALVFIGFVNQASGRDLGWFFDVHMYQAELPELLTSTADSKLNLRWKTRDDKPFPTPVEVRIGGKVETVAMTGGEGSVALPDGATWTLDPRSTLLRRAKHIEELQEYEKEKRKTKAG